MQAVQVLLEYRERLNTERSDGVNVGADSSSAMETKSQVDPIQVSLDHPTAVYISEPNWNDTVIEKEN